MILPSEKNQNNNVSNQSLKSIIACKKDQFKYFFWSLFFYI